MSTTLCPRGNRLRQSSPRTSVSQENHVLSCLLPDPGLPPTQIHAAIAPVRLRESPQMEGTLSQCFNFFQAFLTATHSEKYIFPNMCIHIYVYIYKYTQTCLYINKFNKTALTYMQCALVFSILFYKILIATY